MTLVKTVIDVVHWSPACNAFFKGYGGRQELVKIYLLFGLFRIWSVVIDTEIVPHYHYVQQRTLGCSEWTSKFHKQIEQLRQQCEQGAK